MSDDIQVPRRRHGIRLRSEPEKERARELQSLGGKRSFGINGGHLYFDGLQADIGAVRSFLQSEGSESDLDSLRSALNF